MPYTPLPIGIDDFKKIRDGGYYYVDKSWMIKELLDKRGEVNLFTRPRRFGKTLNMSMLRYYFEKPQAGNDYAYLFNGMTIMDAGEQYTKKQQQYPVISLTLKSAKQPDWELAYAMLKREICSEFDRHQYILEDEKLRDKKERYRRIMLEKGKPEDYVDALKFLSQCLSEYYQKKVIILIDEYDVPLENAYYAGFYDEMIAFIRSLFESALKTNLYLEFSVITGCLRISKESIFTGLNNLKVISILNQDYDEYFGFVDSEVMDILDFYDLNDKKELVKQWYDGYLFGNTEVYNPWSLINFIEKLCVNKNAFPTAAWSNTSSNSIVKDLIYRADDTVRDEIEDLMNGGTIVKRVHEDITYEDIYTTQDNLWNFLFFTGYLKQVSIGMEQDDLYVTLAIPNKEINSIYRNQVINWFHEEVRIQDFSTLYQSMLDGKADIFQQELAAQLQKTISYMDSNEAFYHGFLMGLFAKLGNYVVKSNREAGDGRYDICIRSRNISIPPVILELKVAKKYKDMEMVCDMALEQIQAMHYAEALEEEGYTEAVCYGIGFFRKQVKLKAVRKALCYI